MNSSLSPLPADGPSSSSSSSSPVADEGHPALTLQDLAAELAALRARVAKLESVVTFRVDPDLGTERAVVRCGSILCDRLRIQGKTSKPGEEQGTSSRIELDCDHGMPFIRAVYYGEDRHERVAELCINEDGMPEVRAAYALKGAVRLGLNEHLAGDILVKDNHCNDTVNVRGVPHGGAVLIRGKEGDARVALTYSRTENDDGTVKHDGASLYLFRKGGKIAGTFGMQEEGESMVELHSVNGDLQAGLRTTKEFSVLMLQSPTSPAGVVVSAKEKQGSMDLSANLDEAEGHARLVLGCSDEAMAVQLYPAEGGKGAAMQAGRKCASISVRGDDGKPAASLDVYEGNDVALNLEGPDDGGMMLRVFKGQPALDMKLPGATQPSVMLGANEKETHLIFNREGRPLVQMNGSDAGGSVEVSTTMDANNMRAAMAAGAGGASVQVTTMDGITLASMHGQTYGGALALSSELGFPRVVALVQEDMGRVQLDCSGTRGVSACASPTGGAVIAYDADGTPIASLPDGLLEAEDDEDLDDDDDDKDG